MNERGKILVASDSGTFVLRFVGDVRLTLCVAIDDYLLQMFSDPTFEAVVVDLSEAEGIDSTSLGLLAKLAQETQEQTGRSALLVSDTGDVHRALQSVGVDDLFEATEAASHELSSRVLPPSYLDEAGRVALRERVLDAHRRLMSLNEANAKEFKDLVAQLEALDKAGDKAGDEVIAVAGSAKPSSVLAASRE